MSYVKLCLLGVSLLLLFGISSVSAEQNGELAKGSTRPLPAIPMVVDGIRYEPAELARFDSYETLYYVYDARAASEGAVYIFTSQDKQDAYTLNQWGTRLDRPRYAPDSPSQTPGEGTAGMEPMLVCGGTAAAYATLYDSVNRVGPSFGAGPNESIPYLGGVCGGWDDRITAFATGPSITWLQLYKNVEYGGDSLAFQGSSYHDDLSSLGWSNVASSLQVRDH